jgi:hypothetical protein
MALDIINYSWFRYCRRRSSIRVVRYSSNRSLKSLQTVSKSASYSNFSFTSNKEFSIQLYFSGHFCKFESKVQRKCVLKIVVDQHRFNAWSGSGYESDFPFDADPDPDPTSSYTQVAKSDILVTFIHSIARLHYLSHQCRRCRNFQYFGQHMKFSGKSIVYLYIWSKVDTDLDRQALDALIWIRQIM